MSPMDAFLSILFGLIFGSFASCIGWRLFNDKKHITGKGSGRSVCCFCGHKLGFLDLIPLFSFICLRGRCRYCKKRIPLLHIFAEILVPSAFLLSAYLFDGINQQSILLAVIAWCLITQSIVDCRVMMSSDVIHIITFVASFLFAKTFEIPNKEIAIMIVMVFFLFVALGQIMKIVLKKDSLGFGDIKLFVALAPVMNLNDFVLFLGLTGFSGIVFYIIKNKVIPILTRNKSNKNKEFPFIPAIAFGFMLDMCIKIIII